MAEKEQVLGNPKLAFWGWNFPGSQHLGFPVLPPLNTSPLRRYMYSEPEQMEDWKHVQETLEMYTNPEVHCHTRANNLIRIMSDPATTYFARV